MGCAYLELSPPSSQAILNVADLDTSLDLRITAFTGSAVNLQRQDTL
jgi:hypothetical protein